MATDLLRDPLPVALNYLYWQLRDQEIDIADVTTIVDAQISSAGPQLSNLTLTDLHRLAYLFPKTYDNTQSDGRGTWDQVHDLVHAGLARLTAADAPKNNHSGLGQLKDLEFLAGIKANLAKGQSICPIIGGLSSCYCNVDAAIIDRKAALILLPIQAWNTNSNRYCRTPSFDVLEQGIYTSIALGKSDKDGITQLIARVLSSTQTREQVAEIAKNARGLVPPHAQEPIEDILTETFRMLDLKDVEAGRVQMIDTKDTDAPAVLPEAATEAEPVDGEVIHPTQIPVSVQQISKIGNGSEEDNAATSLQSASLLQQSDDPNTNTDTNDSPHVPVEELPANYTNHQTHAQELKCMAEGVPAQKTARSQDDLCPLLLRLQSANIIDKSEERHQDVIHHFNRLETFLADKEAKKHMIEDLQGTNALLYTELAVEKAAHTQSRKCCADAERDCESARRKSALQVKQLQDCLDTAELNIKSMVSTIAEARDIICQTRTGKSHFEGELERAMRAFRLDHDEFDRWVVKLRTLIDGIDEKESQALTDLAKSESDKTWLQDRINVLTNRVDFLAKWSANKEQAHQETRTNADGDARSFKMEVECLQTRLEIAATDKMNMELQVESLEANKDRLEKALSAKEDTIEELQGWSDSDQYAKEAMTSQVEALEVNVSELEEALAAEEKASEYLQALLNIGHSNKRDLIAAHKEEKASLEKNLAAKEGACEELCRQITSLQSDKANMDTTTESLEAEKETLKDLLAMEEKKRQELQEGFNGAQCDKQSVATAHATLASKTDDLEESLITAQEANIELQKRFDDVCCEKKALNAENIILEADKEALEEALAAKQKDLEETEDNLAICKAEDNKDWPRRNAAETERDRLREAYGTELNAREESEAKLEQAKALIHRHEIRAANLAAENDEMAFQFQKCRLALTEEKEAHNKTINKLSDPTDCWASEIKALEASLIDAQIRNTNLLEANSELGSWNDSLCSKLGAADKILDRVKVEVAAAAADAERVEVTEAGAENTEPAAPKDDDVDSDAGSWVEFEDADDLDPEAAKSL